MVPPCLKDNDLFQLTLSRHAIYMVLGVEFDINWHEETQKTKHSVLLLVRQCSTINCKTEDLQIHRYGYPMNWHSESRLGNDFEFRFFTSIMQADNEANKQIAAAAAVYSIPSPRTSNHQHTVNMTQSRHNQSGQTRPHAILCRRHAQSTLKCFLQQAWVHVS